MLRIILNDNLPMVGGCAASPVHGHFNGTCTLPGAAQGHRYQAEISLMFEQI